MLGNLYNLSRASDGRQLITVAVRDDFREEYDKLKDKEIELQIKPARRRRNLDANALAWTVIDAISEKTGIKKNEVYRNAIREIGGVSTIVCVMADAAEVLKRNWETKGTGWQAEIAESRLAGCKNVTLWYGSSTYDTKQMSALIDSLKQDADALGIHSFSGDEYARALEKWDRKRSEAA